MWGGLVELLVMGMPKWLHFGIFCDQSSSCAVRKYMVRSLFCFILLSVVGSVFAQTRPDIDTITLYNLVPGLKVEDIDPRVDAPLDTMVWDDKNRNGIIK